MPYIELLKALKIIRRGSQLDGDHDVSFIFANITNYSTITDQITYF